MLVVLTVLLFGFGTYGVRVIGTPRGQNAAQVQLDEKKARCT